MYARCTKSSCCLPQNLLKSLLFHRNIQYWFATRLRTVLDGQKLESSTYRSPRSIVRYDIFQKQPYDGKRIIFFCTHIDRIAIKVSLLKKKLIYFFPKINFCARIKNCEVAYFVQCIYFLQLTDFVSTDLSTVTFEKLKDLQKLKAYCSERAAKYFSQIPHTN